MLKAYFEGTDAVLIGACHPGDCHYISGNYKARRRVALIKEVLKQYGMGEDRLWLRWIGASEGNLFAETIREMTEKVKSLGPTEFKKEVVA